MKVSNKVTGTVLALGLMCAGAASSVAQTPAPGDAPAPQMERPERGRRGPGPMGPRHMGRRGRPALMRVLRHLDLSEAQRQQVRGIFERHRETFKTQHAELRRLHELRAQGGTLSAEDQARLQKLREEARASAMSMHNEVLGVLTPDQRARIEQMKAERKARREERRERRRQNGLPTPPAQP